MSTRRPEKSESLRVNVTPADREAIKALAVRHEVSEAQVIRWALREYLESKKEEQ